MDFGQAVEYLRHGNQTDISGPAVPSDLWSAVTTRLCSGVPGGLPPSPDFVRDPNSYDFARPRIARAGMFSFMRGSTNDIAMPIS